MSAIARVTETKASDKISANRQRTGPMAALPLPGPLLSVSRLQRLVGNRAVNLALQRYPLAQRCGGTVHAGCPCAEDEAQSTDPPDATPGAPEVGLAGGPVSAGLAQRIESARGGGTSLDGGTRTSMESAFGQGFGDVRVHADSESHSLNQSVSAMAFTTGNDIFFQQGAYQPGSSTGNQLLAHELTHVVQQGGMSGSGPLTVGAAGDSYEQEADAMSGTIARMIQRRSSGRDVSDE